MLPSGRANFLRAALNKYFAPPQIANKMLAFDQSYCLRSPRDMTSVISIVLPLPDEIGTSPPIHFDALLGMQSYLPQDYQGISGTNSDHCW